MLKRVALNIAIPQISSKGTITSERIKAKGNKSFAEISEIIENNINIQIALAELIHLSKDYVHNIGLLNKHRIEDEISDIAELFQYATFIYIDGTPSCMQVSEPNTDSISAYKLLLQKKRLDKFVMHFMSKVQNPYDNETACYELVFDKPLLMNSEKYDLMSETFFNYFRYNDRNQITTKCFPVFGFSLDNIENDPILFTFSKLVKFIFVYTTDMDYPYIRHVTWQE